MIRNALLLCAALLAAACFACAPPPPLAGPPPPPGSITALDYTSAKCPDGTLFVNHIGVLPQGYDPQMNGSGYQPPPPVNTVQFSPSTNSYITTDLYTAFNDAPPLVQQQLCALTAIYINPNDCSNSNPYFCTPDSGILAPLVGAWGFRSWHPSYSDYTSTYISISAALWNQGNTAWTMSAYENSILQYLVQAIGSKIWRTSPSSLPSISVSGTNPNTSDMTVLAALAHELGHVQWALQYTKQNDLRQLTYCPGNYIDFFQGWKYNSPNQLIPKGRWRHFADRQNYNGGYTDHRYSPLLSDFQNPNNDPNALLYQLYQADQSGQPSQPWASFFGAYSPDEDFVETYVLYALMGNYIDGNSGPYLSHLPLTIPGFTGSGYEADIPDELINKTKSALSSKIQCLENIYSSSRRR